MPLIPPTSEAGQFGMSKGRPGIQQWLTINTFKPGIYSYQHVAIATASNNILTTGPVGSASVKTTYGCLALPQGGLSLLPALQKIATTPSGGTRYTVQAIAFDYGLYEPTLGIFFESYETTGMRRAFVLTGVVHSITTTSAVTVASNKFVKFPAITRMIGPFTTSKYYGGPVVTFVRQTPSSGQGPASIASYSGSGSVMPLSYNNEGISVYSYNSRLLLLSTHTYDFCLSAWAAVLLQYTTPFGSVKLGTQNVVINPTNSSLWSVVGSVASGELLVIQQDGGGFLMVGDMNQLSVVRMPGIQSGGQLRGGGNNATPIGVVYCSKNNGAWVWNGGTTSQKISNQLTDAFYSVDTTIFKDYYCCDSYGSWIFFSNGWLYDTTTQSWWKVSKTINNFFCCSHASGMVLFPPKSSPVIAYLMSKTTTKNLKHFSWRSQPFKALGMDQLIDIREIMLWVSIVTGGLTNNVTVSILETTVSKFTFVITEGLNQSPTPFRINTGLTGLNNFSVMVSGHTTTNFTIWSVTVGYNIRQRMGVA